MNKYLNILLILGITFIVISCSNENIQIDSSSPEIDPGKVVNVKTDPNTKETFSKFVNIQEKVSIKFPNNWIPQEEIDGALVMFLSPLEKNDSFQENVSVFVNDLGKNKITLDDFSKSLKNSLKNMKITSDIETNEKLSGVKANSIEYEDNTGKFKWKQIWTVVNNRVYTIKYHSLKKDFNDYKKELSTMIESFEIKS